MSIRNHIAKIPSARSVAGFLRFSFFRKYACGSNNWLFDVIAPDQKTTANVIQRCGRVLAQPKSREQANFKQVVKDGDLRLYPLVARLVDAETLEKMGATQKHKKGSN
ncbi:MAG: hypothetical protein AAF429_12320 [Pseudomonadota bacterium]